MTDAFPMLDEFAARQLFPLDEFQVDGCRSVESDHGVLVCAPTGAGKTIVGEFAVFLALRRGLKCFYTTPIKALSNQKYHDLVDTYGEERIGLLTGDVSINSGADIVVMTTEVLRNMIYADSPALARLGYVVMDEVHYLSDRDRGAVWEEVILNLDESVNIVSLSATVSNSEEFGQWLGEVRGTTDVIVSEVRPVPLTQYLLVGNQLCPLFNADSTRISSQVKRAISHQGEQPIGWGQTDRDRRYKPLGRPEVLRLLGGEGMLPAITFIFSRAGCDGAVAQCLGARLDLTTDEDKDCIAQIVDEGVEEIPPEDLEVLGFKRWKLACTRGFAAHHAGMLPAFRHIVEKLFVQGLLKAVFATETLALGINMPAKTVVLERLVKFNGEAHVDLTPGQFTQLTGRAGRRGIDTQGRAVMVWEPTMDVEAVAGLASTRTYPLVSTFSPGYNMSVNLLNTIGYANAKHIIERSFAQYQADKSVVGKAHELEKASRAVEQLHTQLEQAIDGPVDEFLEYMQLRADLTDAERKAKKDFVVERKKEATAVLAKLQKGDVIALPGKKTTLAVVIDPAQRRNDPRPQIIQQGGWKGRVSPEDFPVPPITVGHTHLPRHGRLGRWVDNELKHGHYPRPKKIRAPRLRTKKDPQIKALREAIRTHPAHNWENRDAYARLGEQLMREERRRDNLQSAVSSARETLGKTFDRILDLLAELDYITPGENPTVTDEGQRLALLHNESDLLIASCLKRGIWDELDPAELAGVVSVTVFENRKEVRGRVGAPTERMATAMNNTMRIYTELSSDEQRHKLALSREPEPGFALAMHQWVAGAPLDYALEAAAASGAELTPGDFVRSCRRVIDVLEQVAKTGYTSDITRHANQAIDAIRRGVVAVGD
ncbi:DEAD/DEAH box helicase [Corynebacterium glucuronolyticum]|uniref:DEAD/DEAH box helicase n=1 Tax=Corynebacterium glucuronolyticum TaxID=39791 RepID=UPI0021AECADA|nr:DEAD/DEAH box helicase [Corynebacterium glucuronolyticum]MCT1442734.1 DEAD/DEAH box helicase [Corynebacterium glucuronolyticum]MCT1562682.1 DEAD/DEAH box helicase [Corynebacterium glucuronolyticum]